MSGHAHYSRLLFQISICAEKTLNLIFPGVISWSLLKKYYKYLSVAIALKGSFFQMFYFRCEVCGFQCRQRASLKYHMTKHKAEADLEFACQICEKRFEKAHNLNVHMSMVHPLTQVEGQRGSSQQQPLYDLQTITLSGEVAHQDQERWRQRLQVCSLGDMKCGMFFDVAWSKCETIPMEEKDLSLLSPRILAGLCNQIGFGVAGVLQSKINRLVVELEHQAAVCRVRKSYWAF